MPTLTYSTLRVFLLLELFGDFCKDFWEFLLFGIGEFGEDEVDVADFFPKFVVAGAEAEAWEVFRAEVGDDGFEAVVAAGGASCSFADGAKGEVKIVANCQNILGRDFVKVGKGFYTLANVVVESLGFDVDGVAGFFPDGTKFFMGFPFATGDFEVKIEGEKAEVVTGEIVLCSGVAEGDD